MQELIESVGKLSAKQRKALAVLLKQKGVNLFTIAPVFQRAADEPLLLSYAQQRQWFLWQWAPLSTAYNIPVALRLKGQLDVAALQRSFQALIERHESLRTVFTQQDDQPVQVVLETGSFALEVDELTLAAGESLQTRLHACVEQETGTLFDLQEGPLMRARLLRLAADDHVLVVTLHHIISDAWSMQVMVEELVQFYAGFSAGRDVHLAELNIQYADYAQWQRQWMEAGEQERQLTYWQDKLGGEQPVLELPTDFPRPAMQSFAGASHALVLDASLAEALKDLARRENTTLFVVLLASFQSLLHRYSGQTDIRVGVPVANRGRAEIERLIGFFVNTQVLKADIDGQRPFVDLLRQVRQTAQDAQAHQDLPFEQLVEALQPGRSLSHSPLFQVMFNHQAQSRASAQTQFGELQVERLEWQSQTAQFDLVLNTTEHPHGIEALFKYATDLFDAQTVERLVTHWQQLLQAIVADPQQCIARLPMLNADESRQILHDWNRSEAAYPDQPIHRLIEAQSALMPDAVALVFGEQSLTYAELNVQANQWAHRLIELGVGPDELVGISVDRSLEMVIGLLAVLKAGGAYVPLDPEYPQDRLAYMIEDSGLSLLLTQGHLQDRLPVPAHVQSLDLNQTLSGCSEANPLVALDGENLAYAIYTSGSTGKPKGVMVRHEALTNFIVSMAAAPGLTSSDRLLSLTTFSFDIFGLELYTPLMVGGRVVMADKDTQRDPELILKHVQEQGISVLQATPSTWRMLLESPNAEVLAGRRFLCGGEALADELAVRMTALGAQVWNLYGPTETTIWSALQPLTHEYSHPYLGKPIHNTSLYILGEDLSANPLGVAGELLIGGDGLARGYFQRPALTAERFLPNPYGEPGGRFYRTGDLARYRADGVIDYISRIDHQVKIRGFRIELGEIEARVLEHAEVREAVVVAQDGAQGPMLVAYVVADAAEENSLRDALKANLHQHLPEYMVPSQWVFLASMPLTPNGKLDRKALPKADASALQHAYVAPVTVLQQQVAQIWQDVLKQEQVGLNDHFFELGGHSLLATQVMSRVRQLLDAEVPLRTLFEHSTLEGFVQALSKHDAAAHQAPALLPVARDQALRLSYAQERQWFLWQLEPQSAAYHIPAALRLRGELDLMALQRSFDTLLTRHESLRTHFFEEDGHTVQRIEPELKLNLPLDPFPQTTDDADFDRQLNARIEHEVSQLFDLRQGPLLRARLLKLAADDHVLILTQHHIVSDRWSMKVTVDELVQFYTAYSKGLEPTLPALPIQYADYAHWQRQWMDDGERERQLAYWQAQLGDEQPVLELPTDHPRPAEQSYRGAQLQVPLSPELSASLRQLAQREQVTVFMVLLASFQALLHRYSGQSDIRVGVPIANRNRLETERLIGFFVNTQVLKAEFAQGMSVRDLLGQVHQAALAGQTWQDLPFEQLVDRLQPQRSLSHNPLFQAMFNHQSMDPLAPHSDHPSLGALEVESLRWGSTTAQFDLTLNTFESEEGLSASLIYATDLFEASTVERLATHWVTLLQGFVVSTQTAVAQLPLLPENELHTLIVDWNDRLSPFQDVAGIQHLIEARAAQHPHDVAMVSGAQTWDHEQLNARANQLAHRLIELGVGPEVRVGVAMPRSGELVVALLAVLKAGGAYVPLDPDYPQDRVAYMLNDSQAKVLITTAPLLAQLPPSDASTVLLEEGGHAYAGYPQNHPGGRGSSSNLAYVIYTSGSTGKPKGVAITHRNVLALVHWSQQVYSREDMQGVLASTSVCFDLSVWEIFVTLASGGSLVMARNALELPELAARDQVRLINTVPSAIAALQRTGQIPDSVRIINLAGEPLKQALVENLYALPTVEHVYDLYGPSEDTTYSTWTRRAVGSKACIGRPLTNTASYLLDAHLQPAPVGVAAELYLAGEGITRGYLFRPGLTAERYVPDPFARNGGRLYRTGDLTRYRADGVIEYVGRIDHQVKVRGFRIELGEIESRLLAQDAVREAIVLAVEGATGQQLVAYVVAHAEAAAQDRSQLVETIKARLKAHLPEYMVPAQLIFLDRLPLTPNGKLDRKALPAPDPVSSLKAHVAPSNDIERRLVEVWQDILKLEGIGITDNFFSLGGDSIVSIQLVSRARQAGLRFTPKDLFQQQTVQALATVVETGEPETLVDQGPASGTSALLPVQQWFFEQAIPDRQRWNQSILLKPLVALHRDWIEQALHGVIEHHDALRLSFDASTLTARYRSVQDQQQLESPFWHRVASGPAEVESLADQAQGSLDLEHGPLLRAVLFDLPDGQQRLLLVAHHLVVDGVSWRILLEDLQDAYRQLQQGQPIAFRARSTSFKDWVRALEEHARSATVQNQLPYWQAQGENASELPCDRPQGSLENRHALTVYTRLDAGTTRRLLQDAGLAYRTQINDLLLTALARVICRWTSQPSALIQLEGHGREELFEQSDLTRTVGWFTSMFPLSLTPASGLADSIKQIKEQIRAVPERGMGYGLLRYLGDTSSRASLAQASAARITFNYLGQFDSSFGGQDGALFAPVQERKGAEHSAQASLGNWLSLNGQVYSGELALGWTFSAEMFEESTIQYLADAYARELEQLIEHCCTPQHRGFTPSDFPLAILTQAQLDNLPVPASRIEDVYGLSPMQRGMLFHALYEPQGRSYTNQVRLDVEGLDPERFKAAWQATVDARDVLRSAFVWQGNLDQPVQVVQRQVTLPFRMLDWQGRTTLKADLEALAEAELAQGFDLSQAPLLRLVLVRTGEQRYHLVYTHHHILMDGWSASQLMGEVLQRYSGEVPPCGAGRYRDYIQWLQRQDGPASERFWKEQLAGLDEPTRLARAIVQVAGEQQQGTYGEHRHALDAPLTQRLRELAQDRKVTLNTLVQAAWLLLLKRYTGQASVAFGATVSGRPADLRGVEQQIGLFINTLPVIASPRVEQSLDNWLHEVQQLNLRLREYEYTPLFDIQRWAAQDGADLFDTLLVFENYPVSEVLEQEAPQELVFKDVSFHERTNYPLTLMVGVGQTLKLNFSYQGEQFSDATIAQVSEQLVALLEQMLDAPAHLALGELKLFASCQQQMLHDWNRSEAAYPDQPIHRLIEAQSALTPDAVALVFGEQSLTYAELNARANQWAHRLIELGVGPDELVGISADRSLEMVIGLLAVLKAGGAYVPLDPEYPQDRLAYMIEDSGLSLLLTQGHLLDRLPVPEHVQSLDLNQALSGYSEANPLVALDGENLAYAIYTSGSTGKPKGVMVRHEALTNFIVSMAAAPGLTSIDRLLSLTTFSFDIFGLELYTPLMVGGRVVMADKDTQRDPELILKQVQEQGISVLQATPSTWRMLLESPNAEVLAGRRFLCGGEALADELAVRMTALGAQVWNLYGPTETTIWSALQPLSTQNSHPYLGKPIHNTSLYILGEDLSANPLGVAGELLIGGDGLARGYFQRPALTAERFLPNPYGEPGGRFYRTGDLARYRADGVIDYISRIDHQVKIRGFRIELGEIEARLLELDTVVEAVVVALSGPTGARLAAYVVPQDRALLGEAQQHAALIHGLNEHLKGCLADYMVPSSLTLLERMPLTPNGKLDRKALPEPGQLLAQEAFVAPHSENEQLLAQIWQDLLSLDRVGITDNFFALGGDSITSIQVVSRARLAGLELTPKDIFQHRTVQALAVHARAVVVEQEDVREHAPLHLLSEEQLQGLGLPLSHIEQLYPLSPMQQGMLFLGLNTPDAELYINQLSIPVQGLDVERFKQAWLSASARHAILRTGFVWQGLEQPLQFVMEHLELPLTELDLREEREPLQRIERLASDERLRGFNLEQPPLQRIVLARLGEDSYQMIWTYHHLLIDGWSVSQLLGEVLQQYSGAALPEPVPYSRYIAWLQRQDQPGSQTFWSKQLAQLDEPTYLANAFPRKQPGQGHHALYSRLGAGATERLKGFAHTQNVTLNTLVQAAWLLLLARYSGQDSVAFGATVAGRPAELAGSDRMLGLFINTLPVIQTLDPTRRLGDWLRDIQDYNLQLREREYTPLADVQRWAGQSGQPLFDSIIVFENHPVDQALNDIADPVLRFGETGSYGRTNIPMDLMVTLEGGLVIEYMYLQESFDEDSMQSIRRNMEGLLATLPSDAERRLGDVGLPDAVTTVAALSDANVFEGFYLHQRIALHAARSPQQPAIVSGDVSYSFGQLDADANRLAHLLIAEGVGPEVRVGVAMPRGPQLIVALLAVFKAGGAYVPLDTQYPRERLTYLMEDSGIALLLTDTSLSSRLPTLPHVRVLELDRQDLCEQPCAAPVVRLQPQNLAYVIYTSGSTGLPKGVAVAHGAIAMHCQAIGERYAMTPDDCELLFMSFAFDGAHERWLTTLTHGGRLLIRDDTLWTPEQTYEALHRYGVTVAAFPPVYLQQLAEHAEREGNPPGVRIYCFGGDAVPQASLALAQRTLKPQFIINGYGPTETVVTPLLWKAGPEDTCGAAYAPIGSKVGARSTYVLDSHLNPLPQGCAGELYLGGFGVARGYLDRPGLTAERFVLDPFSGDGGRLYRTGDLVREREDGVFDYLGRIDNQVKIRGFRIELGEIEARLKGYDGVRGAVVVAREGGSGKQLVGYVVADETADQTWCDGLREQLKADLPDYMVPTYLVPLSSMPVTPNGKLDRKALPEPEAARQQQGHVAPTTELEKALAQIWQTVLKVDRVGLTDNFFELGGDSILSLQVMAKARALKAHGFSLKLRDLMQKPTIAELTGNRQILASEVKPSPVLTLNQGPQDVPALFCVHAGFGTVFDYDAVARQLAGRRQVRAIQCRMLLDPDWQDESLAQMAIDYVGYLRAQQPQGPYHLLGWSLGGTLAMLITAELERQGQQVEFLGLMDSFVPGAEEDAADDLIADLRSFIQVMTPGEPVALPSTLDESAASLGQVFTGLLASQTLAVREGALARELGAQELARIFSVARHLKRLSLDLTQCGRIQAKPYCWWAEGHERAAQALSRQIGQPAAGPVLPCGHFDVPDHGVFLASLDEALNPALTPVSA